MSATDTKERAKPVMPEVFTMGNVETAGCDVDLWARQWAERGASPEALLDALVRSIEAMAEACVESCDERFVNLCDKAAVSQQKVAELNREVLALKTAKELLEADIRDLEKTKTKPEEGGEG